MHFELPLLEEIELHLVNPKFVLKDSPQLEDYKFNFGVHAHSTPDNSLFFFLSFGVGIPNDEDKVISLLQTTYLSEIKITEPKWEQGPYIKCDKTSTAHLLGMSILMARGSINRRLAGSSLSELKFPILSPMELLKENLKMDDGKFIIPIFEEQASKKSS